MNAMVNVTESVAANVSTNAIKLIGFKAYQALSRAGGDAQVIPGFAHTPYLHVNGEIIWLGSDLAELHPRAVIMERPFLLKGKTQHFDTSDSRPWYPHRGVLEAAHLPRVMETCRALCKPLQALAPAKGFGSMLLNQTPEYPLNLASRNIENIACGFRKGSPEHVYQAALPLIGFGPGVTPPGDDFIGAALFGRALLDQPNAADAAAWDDIAQRLLGKAKDRSHIISSTLMADLIAGHSFAPLHQLAEALMYAQAQAEVIAAIQKLIRIGHSSGWDMLSGFIVGLTGRVSLCD
jgi:hypothetical protein